MKTEYIYVIIIIFILSAFQFGSSFAQNKIVVRLIQPPPNKLSVGDVWKMTLENLTDSALSIYMVGTVDKDNNRVVDGTSSTIQVPPGKSNYNYRSFETGSVNWYDNTLKEFILRTGNVPAGNYETCIQAFSSSSNVPLSTNTCIQPNIIRDPTAVINIISPSDGEDIDLDAASGIDFVWTSNGIKGPYTLRIVEMKDNQTKEAAIQGNVIFFEKKNINYLAFNFPMNERKIESGKKYAWIVTNGKVESDPNSFGVSSKIESLNPKIFVSPSCTDFENGAYLGWQVSNATLNVIPSGGNPGKYLETMDNSEISFFSNSSTYNGNWIDSLCNDCCGSFCFDIKYIFCGMDNTSDLTMQPTMSVEGGGFKATFYTSNTITVGDGWHSFCVPFKRLSPGDPLPFNSDGHWVTTCTISQWNTLFSNVTKVTLPVDPGRWGHEKIGYDNICKKNSCQCSCKSPDCPKFSVSSSSIKCNINFSTNSYNFKFSLTNFSSSAGIVSLTSMTSGMTLNNYSPSTASPNSPTIISGKVTGTGTNLCFKVSLSITRGYSCDTVICFTLPNCQIINQVNIDTLNIGLNQITQTPNFNSPSPHLDTAQIHVNILTQTPNKDTTQIQVLESNCPEFSIGQNYGGGIIFYIDSTCHGLIAAPVDQVIHIPFGILGAVWAPYYGVTNANGSAVGTGQSNTSLIVAQYGFGNYAASVCDRLNLNGYSDWFLPSKDELNLMYINKDIIGGFQDFIYYWSSSEWNFGHAWCQNFTQTGYNLIHPGHPMGRQQYYEKYLESNVRAIRKF